MSTKATLGIIAILVVIIAAAAGVFIAKAISEDMDDDKVTVGINYYGNGGTTSDGKDHFGLTYEGVQKNRFYREGYTFICWNTKANGGGDAFFPGDTLNYGDKAYPLYAQWGKNAVSKYAVSVTLEGKIFHHNAQDLYLSSGEILKNGSILKTEETITCLVGTDWKYYSGDDTFVGILDDVVLTLEIELSGGVSDVKYSLNKNGQPQVKFDVDGQVEVRNVCGYSPKNITYYNIIDGDKETYTQPLVAGVKFLKISDTGFSNAGGKFKGWNTSPDGSGVMYQPGESIPLNVSKVFAAW